MCEVIDVPDSSATARGLHRLGDVDRHRRPEDGKRHEAPQRADSDPFVPALDKRPAERSGKEVREAIEADALSERKGEPQR